MSDCPDRCRCTQTARPLDIPADLWTAADVLTRRPDLADLAWVGASRAAALRMEA